MIGADYIAEFLYRKNIKRVFVLTGGACAFMIDAVHRHPHLDYVCFQSEQAAAMAADAVWRVDRDQIGVTMATSGPGATNLITGIACSYFDSIPSLHITGQVNTRESASYMGAKVRQAGFQETNIVDMVGPITKYAVLVRKPEDLPRQLAEAYRIATTGRMGPVLVDVPMEIQQAEIPGPVVLDSVAAPEAADPDFTAPRDLARRLSEFFAGAKRPVVLFGAGVGLAGVEQPVAKWLEVNNVPFVSSWGGLSFFDHDLPSFLGGIGVYGNRGANSVLQNCDALLVLGSRLDNRQRSGNFKSFAPAARVFVVDVDAEELKKYRSDGYDVARLDCGALPDVLARVAGPKPDNEWLSYLALMKNRYFGRDIGTFPRQHNTLAPFDVVRRINGLIKDDAIVIGDTGATVCWLYQAFHRRRHTLFTAAGNSPMGYSLPAAIGAKLISPHRQIVSISGDGGFHINIQELQTLVYHRLNIALIVFNNNGFGIIKQFQDSYLGSRYAATGTGHSVPDFGRIAGAYGIRYRKVETLDDLTPDLFDESGPVVIDIRLDENTRIEPKLEMGRPINDQFPYMNDAEFADANPFVKFERPRSS